MGEHSKDIRDNDRVKREVGKAVRDAIDKGQTVDKAKAERKIRQDYKDRTGKDVPNTGKNK